MNDRVFKAISDETRRNIIALLSDSAEPLTIKDISSNFDVTRQAITKHLDILEDAKLIETKTAGRDRLCYVDLRPLRNIAQWINNYQVFWSHSLDDLGEYLDKKTDVKRD